MSYSFDGASKLITLPIGMTSLDLIDLHSRWKDWVRSGNAGYEVAFLTVGGDIPAIPLYIFLLNGWRLVPQASDHTLTVSGGLLEVQGGGDPFVDPQGSFKIRINRNVPGIAIGYASTGSDPLAVATAVWNHASALATITKLQEAWGRLGLDPLAPLITGQASVTFGDVVMAITEAANQVTLTRQ